jgi:hypothetical protein
VSVNVPPMSDSGTPSRPPSTVSVDLKEFRISEEVRRILMRETPIPPNPSPSPQRAFRVQNPPTAPVLNISFVGAAGEEYMFGMES